MKDYTFSGIWPVVPTPLTADEKLDVEALHRIIEFEIAAGVDGLWMLGSRGEGPNLSRETHRHLISVTKEVVGERVPVISGCAAPGTQETIDNIHRAEDAGADLVQVAQPYYYNMREPWILTHYEMVLEAASVPVVLYFHDEKYPAIVPGICPEVVTRFASHPNCVGIKAATADFVTIQGMVLSTQNINFGVTVAYGNLVYAALLIGCSGAASPEAAFLPKLYVDIYKAVKAGKLTEAWDLQKKAIPFSNVFQPAHIPSSKTALHALGLGQEHLSKPFLAMPEPYRQELIDMIQQEYGPEYTSPYLQKQ